MLLQIGMAIMGTGGEFKASIIGKIVMIVGVLLCIFMVGLIVIEADKASKEK